ncbi:MAG: radical SAM family heme chaperone HemW [Geobacter sp.]|nr:radical SAM family heme chaperone HemW [Geobacter sp.]
MCHAVYIHIPYCSRKCSYCDFNSTATPVIPLEQYTELLKKEIRSAGDFKELATIYLGGGTPSLLTPGAVAAIINELGRGNAILPDAEITLEANPGTVTRASLEGYLAGGVNRLSIGVQSMDDRELAFLGRIHSAGEAAAAFEAARAAGFTNIGIDLMHSLPGQTLEGWRITLETAIAMGPEHISAYGLTIEPGTPLSASLDAGEIVPQDEDLAVEMFELTAELLGKAGYEHYEISNFALPGYRSRHNQVYWQRGSYRGFGAGAHSFQREPGYGVRWANPAELSSYASLVTTGAVPDNELLQKKDAMAEIFFLGLRMLDGVDLESFRREFGASADAVYPGVIDRFVALGLLRRSATKLQLTPQGVLLANAVLAEFIPSP